MEANDFVASSDLPKWFALDPYSYVYSTIVLESHERGEQKMSKLHTGPVLAYKQVYLARIELSAR